MGKTTIEIAEIEGITNQRVSQILRDTGLSGRAVGSLKIAEFKKVSLRQFKEDWRQMVDPDADDYEIKEVYDSIRMPDRATIGSAGYDFYSPLFICLRPGETIHFPTGIRCKMDVNWALLLMPKSSLGSRYRLGLSDTVGLIDSDYYSAKNQGDIQITLCNSGKQKVLIDAGRAVAQGVFIQYGMTVDDNASDKRTGGFGSTER